MAEVLVCFKLVSVQILVKIETLNIDFLGGQDCFQLKCGRKIVLYEFSLPMWLLKNIFLSQVDISNCNIFV